MDLQKFIREKQWKKMKKDQWLILFLAGVLLLVIAIPTNCGGAGEEETDQAQTEEDSAANPDNYEEELERRLEEALSQMEGAGKVKVMITFQDEGEAVVEKDVEYSAGTQTEGEDSGSVSEESGSSEETVYGSDDEPFVNKQIYPAIEGVLILAEGGEDAQVEKNISEAVEALFGLEAHKIKVVKMNLQEGSN